MSRVDGREVRVEERGSRDDTSTRIQGSVTQSVKLKKYAQGLHIFLVLVFFLEGTWGARSKSPHSTRWSSSSLCVAVTLLPVYTHRHMHTCVCVHTHVDCVLLYLCYLYIHTDTCIHVCECDYK